MDNNSKKMYLFILCPPFCGSTILLKILGTSPNVSTFLGKRMVAEINGEITEIFVHKGEGQFLYEMYGEKGIEYTNNRHNSDYKLPLSEMNEVWNKHWNLNSKILCDKSPPLVHFAKQLEDFYGEDNCRFIVMNRDPYSCRWSHYNLDEPNWVKFAEEQRYNLQNLKNVIYVSYEQLVNEPQKTKNQLLNFIPELKNIDMGVENVDGLSKNGFRNQKLTTEFLDRVLYKDIKNRILKNGKNIMEYFNYEYIE